MSELTTTSPKRWRATKRWRAVQGWHLAQAFLRDIPSPEWSLFGQGVRFAVTGGLASLIYLTTTTLLHSVLDVRFQIALAIGFILGITVHYTLQRLFVWRHVGQFALSTRHQVARYLAVAGSQYGITVLSTARLPRLLGVPVNVVYVTTVLTMASINFIVFRGRVFHPRLRPESNAGGELPTCREKVAR